MIKRSLHKMTAVLCSAIVVASLAAGIVSPGLTVTADESEEVFIDITDEENLGECIGNEIESIITAVRGLELLSKEEIETLKERIAIARSSYESMDDSEKELLSDAVATLDHVEQDIIAFETGADNEAEDKANSWRFINGESAVDLLNTTENSLSALRTYKLGLNGTVVENTLTGEKEYSDKNVIIGYTGDDENIIDENKTYVVPIDEDAIGLFGVDISVYQANIDWKKIADKGEVKYVIIRCGWGENITKYDDRLFETNAIGCEKYGIPYGVYLYSYAYSPGEIASEVAHTLRLLQNRHPAMPVYIDLEENRQYALGDKVLSAMALDFCTQIENQGYEAGVYSSTSWYNNVLVTFAQNPEFSHWVAHWQVSKCTYKGTINMWQFSVWGDGNPYGVEGIPTAIDVDYWYGDTPTGTKYITPTDDDPDKQSMHRVYNPNSGEHFYTSNIKEGNGLIDMGWRYEGVSWIAPKKSKTPVYRLYNPKTGEHHYTRSKKEVNTLLDLKVWNYEGVGWYSDDQEGMALLRLYNPNANGGPGAHFYTVSKYEKKYLVQKGWNDEGVGWYGVEWE